MRGVALEMSAAVYHNCEWLYEQIRLKCEENGTEYTSRGLRQKVTSLVKGYTRQILKAVFSEYSDTGSEECLIYMKLLLSAMRINSVHGNVVFRKGPDNDEIQAIIIDELLLDTDIQMLYELLCIDKCRLISKMRYKPGAADEYVEARRAECIKRREKEEKKAAAKEYQRLYYERNKARKKAAAKARYYANQEEMCEKERQKRKNMTPEQKAAMLEYQTQYKKEHPEQDREYRRRYREKMKRKREEEKAKENLKKNL